MKLDEWKASGRCYSYNRHSVFYRDEGEGKAILLIHGFPTASWDWNLIWPALTRNHRVLAPDMIGFGFSDKPSNYSYSIHDQANLHEQFLRDQKISDVHILAHDYGDTVAQELLARQKDGSLSFTINSLCFLNGGLFPETHQPLLIQRLLMTPVGPLIAAMFGKKKLEKSFRKIFNPNYQFSEEELESFWSLVNYNNGKRVIPKLIRYMKERQTHRERWVGALTEADIPIRVIDGLLDPVSGAHMVARYRELVPNPDVVELPQVGHYPAVEAPDGVSQHYLAFLAGVNVHATAK